MTTVSAAIDTFRRATDLNLEDPIRSGSLLCPPDYSQVVMTGDMHGHRRTASTGGVGRSVGRTAARRGKMEDILS